MLELAADVLHPQVDHGRVVGVQRLVGVEHTVEDGVGDALLGEVRLVDEVRPGVVGEDVAEGDPLLQGHDVVRVAGGGVEGGGQAGGGVGVVLADPAAALGAAGVDPVVLVDLFGGPSCVVEDVHRVAGDCGGGPHLTLAALAGVVGGEPGDAVVGEGGSEVGVVGVLLGQDAQAGVLAGDEFAVVQGQSAGSAPHPVERDLVGQGGPADPLHGAVRQGGAPPGDDGDVLFAAEEGVRVGVVDPAELVLPGEEAVGERVVAAVVLAVVDAARAVVGEVEGEAAGVLPVGCGVHVAGGHADRVGFDAGVGAVDVAGGAVEDGVPAVVGREDVVDVHGEVVTGRAQVDAAGHPVDDAAGQQAELLLVAVVHEGDDELPPPVVPVLADERALPGGAGDGGLDVRGEVGAVRGGGEVTVALADRGRVVLEGHRAVEVAEGAGAARVGDLGHRPVESAGVPAVDRVPEAGLRPGVGVGVDLRDAVRPLVGGERGHLG